MSSKQTMNYEFTSKRIGFRQWKEEDLQPFSMMNADKEVMQFFPGTLSAAESKGFVEKINEMFDKHGYSLYAIDELETNNFMGFIGFWHPTFESSFTPCVEIGWRIKRAYWNKGYATEGATECLKFGFTKLKLKEIYSLTAKINVKSERIMQKIGMKKILEFEHPKVEIGHPLKTHILYKIEDADHHNT